MAASDPTVPFKDPNTGAAQLNAKNEVVIDCQIKDLHYGNFKAVRDIQDSHPKELDYRVHWPLWMR